MYFKIKKSSPLGLRMAEMKQRVIEANKRLNELAEELSDLDDPMVLIRQRHLAGAILAIQFSNHPGKPWVEYRNHDQMGRFFYPGARVKQDSDLWKKWISADNPISNQDFCDLFNLESDYIDDNLRQYRRPGYVATKDYYLIEVKDGWAASVKAFPEDMTEILGSEYRTLREEQSEAVNA